LNTCLPLLRPPFLFPATVTSEIYTLSLHDALPILNNIRASLLRVAVAVAALAASVCVAANPQYDFVIRNGTIYDGTGDKGFVGRSEEHTSELQSLAYLVCRLLLEKKNRTTIVQCHCCQFLPRTQPTSLYLAPSRTQNLRGFCQPKPEEAESLLTTSWI